jgi:hypothetical protein
VSLANSTLPVFNQLTLNWPIQVLVALLQIVLLFGFRWQLVGLLSRAMGASIDVLDRLTRVYARVGTDPRGPLNVQLWRNSVVASAEHIVGIVYVLVLYGLIGVPLIKTVSLSWDFSAEPLVATVIAGLVLLLVAANLLAMWRVSGAVMATIALSVCWVFIGSMPIIDRSGWGGISLQWVAKLLIGLAVVGALLSLRRRVQRSVGSSIAPLLEGAFGRSRSASDPDAHAGRQDVQRWSNALVNLVYLIVTFPILAVPVRKLLEPVMSPIPAAIVVTVVGVLLVLVMVDVLRRAQGFALAVVGLFVCSPTLLGLPLWESGSVGSGLQWVARCIIGLGILALLIGLRGRAQRVAHFLLVPVLDRQISAFYAPKTEAAAEARLHLLELVADGLIDLFYVLCALVAVVMPLAGAFADSSLSWLSTLVYLAFVVIAGWLLFRVWRRAGAAGLGGGPATTPDSAPEIAAAPAT